MDLGKMLMYFHLHYDLNKNLKEGNPYKLIEAFGFLECMSFLTDNDRMKKEIKDLQLIYLTRVSSYIAGEFDKNE